MRNGSDEAGAGGGGNAAAERRARERVARDLARLGVDEAVCADLARRLEPLVRVLSREAYGVALAGVSVTHRVHREREGAWQRSVREISELQRLLGAFADELRKVDTVLGTLTAELKRIDGVARPAAVTPRRVVH